MYEELFKKGNAYDLGDINKTPMNGAKKAAVLIMTLGTDISSNIIKKLSDKQIQKIGVEIANINTVSADERREILQEFVRMNKGGDFSIEGGIDYAKTLLQGAFDDSRADELIEGIKYDTYTKVFMSAREADVNQILSCIQDESAQTIAIILSHIQPDKSAQILCSLHNGLQQDVALKLGSVSNISPSVIKAVDMALEKKLSSTGKEKVETSSGVDSLVDILTKVDGKTEKNIISFLEAKNNILAEKVKSNMFVFENIVNLENITIQKILKEVNVRDMAIALKGANQDVSEVIFRNQSSRASQALKEEIDLLGAIKLSEVEEAKHNIVKIIRRLDQDGVISLVRGDEDEFVV
ncbi:MAG: flagellar motor switch protein FliG [Peptostreptococcaceae bacterium]